MFPDWMILLLGAVLIATGWRTIRRRYTNTDVAEFEGASAVRLGWFWIALGIAFWLAVLLDLGPLRGMIQFFLESKD